MKLVLTCEHAGNKIPKNYVSYFKNQQVILETHRGLDLGALDIFESLKSLSDYSHYSKTSRLLIELNRSLHHKNLFSEFSKEISIEEKEKLIHTYYSTYRTKVENKIKEFINAGETVLHISIHSFTPLLNGEIRNCDMGLLFDSRRISEKHFSKNYKKLMLKINPNYNIRYNYPYLGKADGFTTYLRKQFLENYIGIELEINQKFSENNLMDSQLKQDVFTVLESYSTGKLK
ncbi:N-formylglutamate amidohydrolase [Xanthomarina sp. F1114]|uniref:N-formylglutamate amidohydrolase n=1 Tax=Xanthomarina sp. F1114 TaxID=2996019 RepID=UPI00225DDD3E|nr:N-formylglutamate amidohydrolase [Xanthomarina sp. F1114]MCX7547632.1 N-formylglutamate amidohydrolase [Xanthomarina sp. F1114]